MDEDRDVRRLESGRFLLDIVKYILTGVSVSALITERINLKIGLLGLGIGVSLAIVGVLILPRRRRRSELEICG